jgi:hypothetical protein
MSEVPNRWNAAPENRLSSTTSGAIILILSGYLVGATAGQLFSPVMEGYTMAAGAIGVMGYALVITRSRQKQAEINDRAIQRATSQVERRMEQHVRRVSAGLVMRVHSPAPRPHGHYLPVVRSKCPLR